MTRARSLVPRRYQELGIDFLKTAKYGILADDPGLGKTLQAAEAAVLPAVITCPIELVDQWRDFLVDQYPNDTVSVAAYGDVIKRDKALSAGADWTIINHDMFSRFYIPDAQTLIIDEMHHFRGRNSERSKMIRLYRKRIPRLYGLTATPEFKDVTSLWHLLHLLNPDLWSSYWAFVDTYTYNDANQYGTKIKRVRSRNQLTSRTAPYILRRTYKQVGAEVPAKIDKHITLRLDDAQAKLYRDLKNFYRIETEEGTKRFFNAGAVVHELRKMTITPVKIKAIQQILDDDPNEEPVVIFCMYIETAHTLAKALNGTCVTGEMLPAIRRLQAHGGHDKKRVRVITMKSMSEGVDITEARTVVIAEESYVPGQQHQALSRVIRERHDDTNEDPVLCVYVRYEKTIDEAVHKVNSSRTQDSNDSSVLREALL